jgi:PEP-CTERM motif
VRNRLLCSVFLMLLSAASARAATLTFDSLAQPGIDLTVVGPLYTESGFNVSASSLFSGQTGSQDFTGTGTLLSGTNTFTVAASDASAFDFTGITLWELNRGTNSPIFVKFTGAFAGGGTIAQTVATDGLFNGDAFTFVGFTNLASLHIETANGRTFQIDNVNASPAATPVPEPTSMLLLGTGILGAGVRHWRQKRQ